MATVMPKRSFFEGDMTKEQGDFSFILGGPLFQLLRQLNLSGDALELLRLRVLVITAITWLPLLILSAVQGLALGSSVAVPFLRDIEAQVRFLLVVPLLVAAELVVHQRLRFVARQFLERDLIPEPDRQRFAEALTGTVRLRNSMAAEVALLAFVYVVGIQFIWRRSTALDVPTWYARPGPNGQALSLAGIWYAYFSLPLVQFLLLRWYYRLFIWARFLWQVSRVNLHLVPTHPDRVGGLGFLSMASAGFVPLAVAHGAMVSGWIASRIFLRQGVLLDFKFVIIAVVVFLLILFLGPFLVFSPQLANTKRQGERDYGPLAERYAHQFDAKWVHASSPPQEPLLGTSDVQSLADMAQVYAVVRSMQVTPITRYAIMQLVVAVLVPIAPLALTMMPLGELVKLLLGMLK